MTDTTPDVRETPWVISDEQIDEIAARIGSLSLHATRAHELGGITRTIFDPPGLIEFARAVLAAAQPPKMTDTCGAPEATPDVREALRLAKRELDNCMHNARKGHVCFDGDDFHEALAAVNNALAASSSAAPVAPALQEREAFEAAFRPIQVNWTFDDDGTGGYHHSSTDWAWQGWSARASLKGKAAPVAWIDPEHVNDKYSPVTRNRTVYVWLYEVPGKMPLYTHQRSGEALRSNEATFRLLLGKNAPAFSVQVDQTMADDEIEFWQGGRKLGTITNIQNAAAQEPAIRPGSVRVAAAPPVAAAPYPFCSMPEKCSKAGRCLSNPVCNE